MTHSMVKAATASLPANGTALDGLTQIHFRCIDRDQQVQAVCRLANAGRPEGVIAVMTGWSVEMVRRALSRREGRL